MESEPALTGHDRERVDEHGGDHQQRMRHQRVRSRRLPPVARRFEELTPEERSEAVEGILTEWHLILAERAKREKRESFTGRHGWRKRKLEAAESKAAARAIHKVEGDPRLRAGAEAEARAAIFPTRGERAIYLNDPASMQVMDTALATTSWGYVALARQLGGECPVCSGEGTLPEQYHTKSGDHKWRSAPCSACGGVGSFESRV